MVINWGSSMGNFQLKSRFIFKLNWLLSAGKKKFREGKIPSFLGKVENEKELLFCAGCEGKTQQWIHFMFYTVSYAKMLLIPWSIEMIFTWGSSHQHHIRQSLKTILEAGGRHDDKNKSWGMP